MHYISLGHRSRFFVVFLLFFPPSFPDGVYLLHQFLFLRKIQWLVQKIASGNKVKLHIMDKPVYMSHWVSWIHLQKYKPHYVLCVNL